MTFISYSQNYEDVMLWRALKHIKNGFYIDVGAYSPDSDSVTKAFYNAGWKGINIEPNPIFIEQYKNERKRDINLSVAISDKAGEAEMFFVSNPGLSSLNQEIAEGHISLGWEVTPDVVEVRVLADICNKYCLKKEIHFLKIDIEGLEEKALKGNNWKKFRPWIVIVEATLPMSQVENYKDWEKILLNESYVFAYADGLNRFYIAKEHDELLPAFKYPPNVFDEFIMAKEMNAEQSRVEQTDELHRQQAANLSLQEEMSVMKPRIEKFIESLAVATNNVEHLENRLEEKGAELLGQQAGNLSLQEEMSVMKPRIEKFIESLAIATNNVEHLENRLEEKGAELLGQQAGNLSLQEEMSVMKPRIEQFIESLAVATNNVEHLENRLEEKGAELLGQQAANHTLEEELNATKPRIEKLVESLAIAKNTVEQLEAKNEDLSEQQIAIYSLQEQLDSIAQKSNEQSNELDKANLKIDELNQSSHHWWTIADQQSNELDEARAKVDELHQSNHRWWLEAEKFTKELHTVHKSKSWRITWPLRKTVQLLKWLFRLPVQFVLWIVCLPKRITRWIVVKAMAYTFNHPKLKMRAIGKLRRYPKLEKKLRLLAQAQGLVASPVATTTIPAQPTSELSESNDNTIDLSQLTPCARSIYGELKAAMEQSQKENS